MPSQRVTVFLEQLRLSQLVTPGQINEASRHPLASNDDPFPLTKELVLQGWLTAYQAQQLLKGYGKDLQLGPYRLQALLGEGGMGQVFKAYHQPMDRTVALKVIRKEKLANPTAVQRFHQEIRAAAQLTHPNIVTAFDAGQVGDTYYFAMEFVEGVDLGKLVKMSGPLPVADACDYIRQAAQGLQHAHERGMVHRDIKPSNLLLSKTGPQGTGFGVIKILDMGLARINDPASTSSLTRISGTVIGTPAYLAPEQAKDSHKVDIRADLYSLGCTFYYFLTGNAPFKGATVAEVLVKHQVEPPAPLDQVRPDVPPQLWLVVKRLLAKKPDERYQTPADLLVGLAPFTRAAAGTAAATGVRNAAAIAVTPLARQKITATAGKGAFDVSLVDMAAPASSKWAARRSRKNRRVAILAALVLLALMGGGAWAFRPQIEQFVSGLTNKSNAATPAAEAEPVRPKLVDEPVNPPPSEPKSEPESKSTANVESKPAPGVRSDPPPQPKAKVEPKPQPKPVPQKPAVPDAAQQAAAEKNIRELYKAQFAKKKNADMIALANKLIDEAAPVMDDLAVRYVLLREARDLGIKTANPEVMLKAIDEMDKTFAVNAVELKIAALDKASTSDNLPATMRAIVDATLKLVDDAVEDDNYDVAGRLMTVALAAARRGNSTVLFTKVKNEEKEVAEIAKQFQSAKPARDKLAKSPDDDSSYKWGKFLTYFKGHWGDGLPLLASGNDEKVGDQADKDLANPKEAADQMAIGDGWYALGEADKSPVAKKNLWLRAKFWYDQALPSLAGVNKAKVEKQLKEIETILPKEDTGGSATAAATGTLPRLAPKNDFDIFLQNGQNYLRAGRYPNAADAFEKALKIKPDDAKAQAGLKQARYAEAMQHGIALGTQGNYLAAAGEFRKALEEIPGDTTAERLLALAMKPPGQGGQGGFGQGGGQSPFMKRGKKGG
jgi:serine/threonine-protein kinase